MISERELENIIDSIIIYSKDKMPMSKLRSPNSIIYLSICLTLLISIFLFGCTQINQQTNQIPTDNQESQKEIEKKDMDNIDNKIKTQPTQEQKENYMNRNEAGAKKERANLSPPYQNIECKFKAKIKDQFGGGDIDAIIKDEQNFALSFPLDKQGESVAGVTYRKQGKGYRYDFAAKEGISYEISQKMENLGVDYINLIEMMFASAKNSGEEVEVVCYEKQVLEQDITPPQNLIFEDITEQIKNA